MAETIARTRATGATWLQKKTVPRDGWTQRKQEQFLAVLSTNCNVAASCRAVKMSDQSVYRLRQRSPEFRAGWALALREGYARLEMQVLQQMLGGIVKPVFHGGKKIGQVKEFALPAALQLLRQHRGTVVGEVAPPSEEEQAAIRAALTERFEEMAVRLGATPEADRGE